MNTNGNVVLVTGATGRPGGASTRHLLAAGWRVCALVQNANEPAARVLADSGVRPTGLGQCVPTTSYVGTYRLISIVTRAS